MAELMSWIPITDINLVPKDKQLLFWNDTGWFWFEGKLIDDSEYGIVIVIPETYSSIKRITHYMNITPP